MNRRRLLAALALLAAVGGCDDGPKPSPGSLEVRLEGALTARSARFRIVGPTSAVAAPGTGAVLVYAQGQGDTVEVAVFAPQGSTLNGSVVAVLEVPDQNAAARYEGLVLEAASPFHSLRPASQYTLTFVRP